MKLREMRRENKSIWEPDSGGNIDIFDFKDVTSLVGAPKIVHGYFDCGMTSITSLHGAPRYVGGFFDCSSTELKSLHNVHKEIREVLGMFYFQQINGVICTHIIGLCLIKGLVGIRSGNIGIDDLFKQTYPDINLFQEGLIEAGFTEQAKL